MAGARLLILNEGNSSGSFTRDRMKMLFYNWVRMFGIEMSTPTYER
jgi:hypothetical protein